MSAIAPYVFVDEESVKNGFQRYALDLFEREQKEVLALLPKNYVERFGEIGFCHERPVQIVSPYSIPPGSLRRKWMNAFTKLKAEGKLAELPYLLYWFDASLATDPEDCVFLNPSSDFMKYEDGVKKQYDLIPRKIQIKIMNHEPLDEDDKIMMEGSRKMQKAMEFPIEQRLLPFDSSPDPDHFEVIPRGSLPPEPVTHVTKRKDWNKMPPRQGMHIAVYCDKKKEYSHGFISKQHREFFLIMYDNDVHQWIPLMDHKYKVLDEYDQELFKKEIKGEEDFDLSSRMDIKQAEDPSNYRRVSMIVEEHETLKQIHTAESQATGEVTAKQPVASGANKTASVERVRMARAKEQTMSTLPDGCLKPKRVPRRLEDGSFAKPPGRVKAGFVWDYVHGVWAPVLSRSDDLLKQSPPAKKAKKTHPATSANEGTKEATESGPTTPMKFAAAARSISSEDVTMNSAEKSGETVVLQRLDDQQSVRSISSEDATMSSAEKSGDTVVLQQLDDPQTAGPAPQETEARPAQIQKPKEEEPVSIDKEQLRHVENLKNELATFVPLKDSLDDASTERCRTILESLRKLPFDGPVRKVFVQRIVTKFKKHETLGSLARSLCTQWKDEFAKIKIGEWKNAVDKEDVETAKAHMTSVLRTLKDGNISPNFVESVPELSSALAATSDLFEKNKIMCQELVDLEEMVPGDDDFAEEKCVI